MSMEEWTGQTIPDDVICEASNWIARLDSEVDNSKLQQTFEEWVAVNPLHQAAFEELSLIWARTSVIKSLSEHVHRSTVVQLSNHLSDMQPSIDELTLSPIIQEPLQPIGAISVSSSLYPIAIGCITIGMLIPVIASFF